MSALKKGSFSLYDEVYNVDILVCVGIDFKKAQVMWHKKARITDAKIESDVDMRGGYFGMFPDHRNCLLWFRPRPAGWIVAHECFHATSFILRESGLVLTNDSEEAFAYYLGWLVRQIGNKVW